MQVIQINYNVNFYRISMIKSTCQANYKAEYLSNMNIKEIESKTIQETEKQSRL